MTPEERAAAVFASFPWNPHGHEIPFNPEERIALIASAIREAENAALERAAVDFDSREQSQRGVSDDVLMGAGMPRRAAKIIRRLKSKGT